MKSAVTEFCMNCSVQLREDHQERSMELHRRDSPTGTSIFMPEEPRLQYDGSQLTVPIIRGGGHWARITLMIKRSMIQVPALVLKVSNVRTVACI